MYSWGVRDSVTSPTPCSDSTCQCCHPNHITTATTHTAPVYTTGAAFDTAAGGDGVTVLRMVPAEQVTGLRETVSDLYRQLRQRDTLLKQALGLLRAAKEVCEETVAMPEQGPELCADLGQELELFLANASEDA